SERTRMLLLETRPFDVSASCRSRPHSAFRWEASRFPPNFQNTSHAGTHWEHTSRCRRFPVRNEKGSVAAIGPSKSLPTVDENILQVVVPYQPGPHEVAREAHERSQVPRFFCSGNHVLAVTFAR